MSAPPTFGQLASRDKAATLKHNLFVALPAVLVTKPLRPYLSGCTTTYAPVHSTAHGGDKLWAVPEKGHPALDTLPAAVKDVVLARAGVVTFQRINMAALAFLSATGLDWQDGEDDALYATGQDEDGKVAPAIATLIGKATKVADAVRDKPAGLKRGQVYGWALGVVARAVQRAVCDVLGARALALCADGLVVGAGVKAADLAPILEMFPGLALDVQWPTGATGAPAPMLSSGGGASCGAGVLEPEDKRKRWIREHVTRVDQGEVFYVVREDDGTFARLDRGALDRRFEDVAGEYDEKAHKYKRFIKEWCEDPRKLKARRAEMVPPPLVCPPDTLNTWPGLGCAEYEARGDEREASGLAYVLEFVQVVICAGDASVWAYIWQYMAHLVQRPGSKDQCPLLFILGLGGTGKDSFAHLMRRLVGKLLSATVADTKLVLGDFNEALDGKLLVTITEGTELSASLSQRLKELISESSIQIHGKCRKPVATASQHRVIWTCNHVAYLIMEEAMRRRVLALDVSNSKIRDDAYFTQLFAFLDDDGVIAALRDALMAVDLTDFKPSAFPETALGKEMARSAQSAWLSWGADVAKRAVARGDARVVWETDAEVREDLRQWGERSGHVKMCQRASGSLHEALKFDAEMRGCVDEVEAADGTRSWTLDVDKYREFFERCLPDIWGAAGAGAGALAPAPPKKRAKRAPTGGEGPHDDM